MNQLGMGLSASAKIPKVLYVDPIYYYSTDQNTSLNGIVITTSGTNQVKILSIDCDGTGIQPGYINSITSGFANDPGFNLSTVGNTLGEQILKVNVIHLSGLMYQTKVSIIVNEPF